MLFCRFSRLHAMGVHKIIELLWLETPLRSSSPTVNPSPPCPLNHALQCLTTLSVKKFLLTSNLNTPWWNFKPWCPLEWRRLRKDPQSRNKREEQWLLRSIHMLLLRDRKGSLAASCLSSVQTKDFPSLHTISQPRWSVSAGHMCWYPDIISTVRTQEWNSLNFFYFFFFFNQWSELRQWRKFLRCSRKESRQQQVTFSKAASDILDCRKTSMKEWGDF